MREPGGPSCPRLVIAGVASGVGKTTVTVALARAFTARGLVVAPFKCGPDYLDPTYHGRAAGRASQNLDGWMMGRDAVLATFERATAGADVALIEGVMGLYDGASPTGEAGSTAEIAKWLAAPVVLVVDASGMARSFAALAGGFADFDPDLRVEGALANRVGSSGHLDLLRRCGSRVAFLGGLPKDAEHAFAERHLGLHSADERVAPEALLEHWGSRAAEWMSVDALLELARSAAPLPAGPAATTGATARRCRIGIARDAAFHFYYADNLRRLEGLGAELVPFSPMTDTTLPDVEGLYIGGGYPEVHAAELSANTAMRRAVAEFAGQGGVVYAECGGLVYLTRAIRTLDGRRHEMVGLFPTEACMGAKLRMLGYVEVETRVTTALGPRGTRFRGHQFRYSELEPALNVNGAEIEVERVYSIRARRGSGTTLEGYRKGNVLASYVHAHWASNPSVAASLVESCAERWRQP